MIMEKLIRNIFIVAICLTIGGFVESRLNIINTSNKETPNLMVIVTAYKGEDLIAFDSKSFEFKTLLELSKVRGEFQALSNNNVKIHTFIYYK